MRRKEILDRAWAARERKEEFINSLPPEEAYANKSQAAKWQVIPEAELEKGVPPYVAVEGKYYHYDSGELFIAKQTHETTWEHIPTTSPDYFEKIKVEAEPYVEEKTYAKNDIVLESGKMFKSLIKENDEHPEVEDAWKKLTLG